MRYQPRLPDDDVNAPPSKPLREFAVLTLGVLAIGGALLLGVSFAAETVAVWIPVSWEARVFGGLWGADSNATGWKSDDRLQSLTGRLAARWPDNPYQVRVFRSDDAEPNAFALPGGAIVITRGLLDAVESENELAFVLGHELGHFRNRDHMRGIGRQLGSQVTLALASAAIGVSFGLEPIAWVSQISERRFGRQQESAADAFALGLLTSEYGHASGALDFFERVPENSLLSGVGQYLSTHPPSAERIRALEALIHDNQWDTDSEKTPWASGE